MCHTTKNTSKDSVQSASVIMGMLDPLSHQHKESQVCKEFPFISKQSLLQEQANENWSH